MFDSEHPGLPPAVGATAPTVKGNEKGKPMSNRTSHRRHASGRTKRTVEQFVSELPTPSPRICRGRCTSQCDDCHDIDNCVEATRTFGDLLLCKSCRANYGTLQPWHAADAETGAFL